MRIGIDMRMAGTGEGIGRYVEELVSNLEKIDEKNHYFLLFQKDSKIFSSYEVPAANFHKIAVASPYYSFMEQTWFVVELLRLRLDLVHFANFNFPLLYPKAFVVTIHDLIHHQFPGKKQSRIFHRAAYRFVIASAVHRAQAVIAVSAGTKNEIVRAYGIPPEKIKLVYQGVDQKFSIKLTSFDINSVKRKYNITKPYIMFAGVWRQYKNVGRLAAAFDILSMRYGHDMQLVLAGKIDEFYPEIEQEVRKIENAADLRPLGFVPEEDLIALYQGAKLFVLPSLIEGFGLIGLEAQSAGVPVAASDISVLNEIFGDSAIYFDPHDETKMAQILNIALGDEKLRARLAQDGLENAAKFTWRKTASETLNVYESI